MIKKILKKILYPFLKLIIKLLIWSNQKYIVSNLVQIYKYRDPVFRILNKNKNFTEKTLISIQNLQIGKGEITPSIHNTDPLTNGLETAKEFFLNLNRFGISLNGKICLDVGCGRGASCIFAVNSGAVEVTGIDTYKEHFFDFPMSSISRGLLTPVIRNAEAKGIVEISSEMKDLMGRAQSGELELEELGGGTFSISEQVRKKINLLEMDIVNSEFGHFENLFDLIWSKNAIEHIPSPKIMLSNIALMLKPGGHFFASFAPLYNCEEGSHQNNVINVPYHQHIFDDETVYSYFEKTDNLKDIHKIIFKNSRDPYPDVNRLNFFDYKKIFCDESAKLNLSILRFESFTDYGSLLNLHMLKFFNSVSAKLSLKELTSNSIIVLMKKI
jgi:SAM-dependent methyltransferase